MFRPMITRWCTNYMAKARALNPALGDADVAPFALALQSKDAEKALALKDAEKALALKDAEKEKALLMQALMPWMHRRAVESLTVRLVENHTGCKVLSRRGNIIWFATIRNLRVKLATCDNKEALRGAGSIYSKLSQDLHTLPLPMSIDSASFYGLDEDKKAFMTDVYAKLLKLGVIKQA